MANNDQSPFDKDNKRIQRVLATIHIDITTEQAEELWSFYSACLYASWLALPQDDTILLDEILTIVKEQQAEGYTNERPEFFTSILEKIN